MARWKNILFWPLFLSIAGVMTGAGIYILSPSSPFYVPSPNQPPAALSIGVVDINSIKSHSKVFQKFTEALNSLNATIHKEILEQETKLRTEYERFKKYEDETKEPTQEIVKQKTEFDKKYAALEKMVRSRREELDQRYTKGLIHIKQTLKKIMDDLGKAHRLKIILNKSIGDGNQMDQAIVLFCNEGLDLTAEVIQRLDTQLLSKPLE